MKATNNSEIYRRRRRRLDHRLLPLPSAYYAQAFGSLQSNAPWISVRCCFHADRHPSLRLHLISGGFYCFSCGVKGGDIIDFHCRRYGLTFTTAVTELGGWAYDH